MPGFKPKAPALEVIAAEMDGDGRFNRLAYKCGCVTVRRSPVYPDLVIWTYLERCDAHGGGRVTVLADPMPPDWWGT